MKTSFIEDRFGRPQGYQAPVGRGGELLQGPQLWNLSIISETLSASFSVSRSLYPSLCQSISAYALE